MLQATAMTHSPRITVGMPVFNSAATVCSALESLLSQTYGDFELIVSDNASTDLTGELVKKIALRDSRIRYVRQPENIGANGNYSYLVRVARGQYFKWAASSDLCAPSFLEKCIVALERNPDAVLAAPRTSLFAGDIHNSRPYENDIEIIDATPFARLERLHATLGYNNALNGLIRTDVLRKTNLIEHYFQADIVLMGHLCLLGKIVRVDDYLYFRRMEVSSSTAMQDDNLWRKHHYPKTSARMLFQSLKRHAGWLRACLATPMPFIEKMRILFSLLRRLYWERRLVWSDLCGACSYFFRGVDGK